MMKKIILSIVIFLSMASVSIAEISYPFPWLDETTTYNVPGSPFTITKARRYAYDNTKPSDSRYYWEYRCILNVTPAASEANLPRIEYVGCQAIYPNNARQYFQFLPNGGVKPLRDINQALYEPSRNTTNPSTYGQYPLFTSQIDFYIDGSAINLCMNPIFGRSTINLPNASTITQINLYAGYGFLTQKEIDMINQYRQVINSPGIQAQQGTAMMDEQTMRWALAQGNMFQYTKYYKIFDVVNTCSFMYFNIGI